MEITPRQSSQEELALQTFLTGAGCHMILIARQIALTIFTYIDRMHFVSRKLRRHVSEQEFERFMSRASAERSGAGESCEK